jgi:molecular chaperone GrpE
LIKTGDSWRFEAVSDTEHKDAKPTPADSTADGAAGAADAAGAPGIANDDTQPFDAIAAAAELDQSMAAEADGGQAEEVVGESYADILESEVRALNEMIKQRDAEIERLKAERDAEIKRRDEIIAQRDAKLAGARDEVEKAKDRLTRDADKRLTERAKKLLLEFVEVLDDLDRAIAAARELDHNPAVIDGVELVRKRFLRELEEHGVTHLPAMGQPFDPNLHEAMAAVPVTDASQDGVVVGVIREGYLFGDAPLRPAGVAVGKASS